MITEKTKETITKETIYVTSDGQEFFRRYDARKHERDITPERKFEKRYIEIEDNYSVCYKVLSEEDYNYLVLKEWNDCGKGVYVGPGWYIAHKYDGGDWEDTYEVYKLDSFIQKFMKKLQELQEINES